MSRPQPYKRGRLLDRSTQISRNSSIDRVNSVYLKLSAVSVVAWAYGSTIFSLGYISFFSNAFAKYFTVVDLQYNSFSYLIYLLPVVIYLGLHLVFFIEPILTRNGKFAPLLFLEPARKVFWFSSLTLLALLIVFVTGVPLISPKIVQILPNGSLVKWIFDLGPIVISGISFTAFVAIAIGFVDGAGIKQFRFTRYLVTWVWISAVLFLVGNTMSALKFDASFMSEVVDTSDGRVGKVMMVGGNFSIVQVNDRAEIWLSSDLSFVRLARSKTDAAAPPIR